MALPKLSVPIYHLKVSSTKQELQYRPFLVKEEKILLMAAESEDEAEMATALKQIINNCVQNEDFDVNILPTFDLEYVFLQLRAKSVGEIADLHIFCQNPVRLDIKDDLGNRGIESAGAKPENEKTTRLCLREIPITVNLSKIKVKTTKGHTENIMLEKENNIGVIMRYPDLEEIATLRSIDSDIEKSMGLMVSCVQSIYDGDSVYHAKDTPPEEMLTWVDGLNNKQMQALQDFFTTMPALKHDVKYECPGCGYKGTVTLEGLADFFE